MIAETATPDMESSKEDVIQELLSIYSHLSRDQMTILVNKCYPDMFEILDLIERKQHKRQREPKGDLQERRAQRALEREEKWKLREEKKARKAELKEAKRE